MLRALTVFLLMGSLLYPAPQKRKQVKNADIEVVEISIRRSGGDVVLDGKVKNLTDKTHTGVILIFDFLATGNSVMTTKKAPLEADVLPPAEQSEFHLRVTDPVRAVWVRVQATDRQERDIKVNNSGPFNIE